MSSKEICGYNKKKKKDGKKIEKKREIRGRRIALAKLTT